MVTCAMEGTDSRVCHFEPLYSHQMNTTHANIDDLTVSSPNEHSLGTGCSCVVFGSNSSVPVCLSFDVFLNDLGLCSGSYVQWEARPVWFSLLQSFEMIVMGFGTEN